MNPTNYNQPQELNHEEIFWLLEKTDTIKPLEPFKWIGMPSQVDTIKLINHILDEMQAQNILQLDVKEKTSITDYMYICTGRSSRHVIAIADELYNKLKQSGLDYLRVSGTEHGEWALIDCGDIIVHIMQPETRAFYNLEELWLNSPSA